MANSAGVINFSSKDTGFFVSDDKGERSRCLSIVTHDESGTKLDQAYFGYFLDQKRTDNTGCNLALAIEDDGQNVRLQIVDVDGKNLRHKTFTMSEFMDLLDSLHAILN